MKEFYFTFGSSHKHTIDGERFGLNTVAVITANDIYEACNFAFELFDNQWSFCYFHKSDIEEYYDADAFIDVEPTCNHSDTRICQALGHA